MTRVRTGPIAGLVAQAALLGIFAATTGLTAGGWLVGLGVGLITAALLLRALARQHAEALGPADRVTLVRAVLAGGIAALIADSFVRHVPIALVVTLATIALVLDGVDGWVARNTRTVSLLGTRFDMEVDAFLILVLSVSVARSVAGWVIVIGLARYLLFAAERVWRWLRMPTPFRYWRKVVAATQGIVLTAAVAGVLPLLVIQVALVAALILLAESFGHDLWWLWRWHSRAGERIRPEAGTGRVPPTWPRGPVVEARRPL